MAQQTQTLPQILSPRINTGHDTRGENMVMVWRYSTRAIENDRDASKTRVSTNMVRQNGRGICQKEQCTASVSTMGPWDARHQPALEEERSCVEARACARDSTGRWDGEASIQELIRNVMMPSRPWRLQRTPDAFVHVARAPEVAGEFQEVCQRESSPYVPLDQWDATSERESLHEMPCDRHGYRQLALHTDAAYVKKCSAVTTARDAPFGKSSVATDTTDIIRAI